MSDRPHSCQTPVVLQNNGLCRTFGFLRRPVQLPARHQLELGVTVFNSLFAIKFLAEVLHFMPHHDLRCVKFACLTIAVSSMGMMEYC